MGIKCHCIVFKFTQPVCSPDHNAIPYFLHSRKMTFEPLAISLNANDHKFLWFFTGGSILNKITLVKICNFKE